MTSAALNAAVRIPEVQPYQIGEIAEKDIVTPVPLVIAEFDKGRAGASDRSLVFVYDANVVTDAEEDLRVSVRRIRTEFLENLLTASKYRKLTPQQAQHPGFDRFVTWFQSQRKDFPLTPELAELWATGESDELLLAGWSDALAETMAPYLVVNLPPATNRIHLINTSDRNQFTNLSARLWPTMAASQLSSVAEAKAQLARRFLPEAALTGEFLARFVKANSLVDQNLSSIAALGVGAKTPDKANPGMHYTYEAGQTIVHSGQIVDGRAKAAIDLLRAKREEARAEASEKWSEGLDSLGGQLHGFFAPGLSWCRSRWSNDRALVLSVMGAIAFLGGCWWILRKRKRARLKRVVIKEPAYTAVLHPARNETVFLPVRSDFTPRLIIADPPVAALPSANDRRQTDFFRTPILLEEPRERVDIDWESRVQATEQRAQELLNMVRQGLAPHLAREMMSELVRKLLSDREGLLRAHNIAARELAVIEQRFARVHTDLLERLEQYQARNAELEKELAERTEQNRQLINTHIEALQRKVQ